MAEWKSKADCPHCGVRRVWSTKHQAKRPRHSLTSNFLAEFSVTCPSCGKDFNFQEPSPFGTQERAP